MKVETKSLGSIWCSFYPCLSYFSSVVDQWVCHHVPRRARG